MGINARKRVLSEYNENKIGELQEEGYMRAIQKRKKSGPRVNQ